MGFSKLPPPAATLFPRVQLPESQPRSLYVRADLNIFSLEGIPIWLVSLGTHLLKPYEALS